MIKPLRFSSLAWWAAPLGALGFLVWVNVVRIQHIEHVSALGGWGEAPSVAGTGAPRSTPELAAGNGLIVPEQSRESLHWIAQTQRMFLRGESRVRHIDYENAPFGRAVHTASPYRWWLGLIAWCDHLGSGRSPAQSVERAALVADPLLHLLFLLGTTLLVAWRWGAFSAALISIGCVALFPFAAEFLPGTPDDRGLAQIFALWSVLLLAMGAGAPATSDDSGKATRRWFFLAGVTAGLGLWVSVRVQVPVLAGVALGALLAAGMARRHRPDGAGAVSVLPWRSWAMGGAVTTLGAYLLEFAPAHLGEWRLAAIHPLHGLAWLGAGEVLAQAAEWIPTRKFPRTVRNLAVLIVATAAVVAVPVVGWKVHGATSVVPELPDLRLTRLPEGAAAQNLGAWLVRDGPTPLVWATLLPVLLVAPIVWLLARRSSGGAPRVAAALTVGPALVALGFACRQLAWWNAFDGLLLVMLVAAIGEGPGPVTRRSVGGVWTGAFLLLLAPGVWQIAPRGGAAVKDNLTRSEVLGLIERDMGAWLALHAEPEGAVVLAPPNESTALCYYGGLRGIGTLSWENREGVAAAVRVLSAPSFQEAKELVERREITHIVVLSWDSYFDEYARAGTGQLEGSFLGELRAWKLPPWLRPVAYQLPTITGFEGQSVTIYAVVENQNEATALGRTAEYFLEMGDLDQAASTAQALRRFPMDLGARVAQAEVEMARGDEVEFARSLKLLQSRLAVKTAPILPWDLRVGLAVVLAKAKQPKLAREQVGVCLATADERKLRALSAGALYRLLVLARVYGLTFDPNLHQRALELLPGDLRARLRS